MRHIPMAEFKDKASEMVTAASHGEEIVITKHGRPMAKLVPVEEEQATERRARVRRALDQLAELRGRMRAEGKSVTIEEIIAWKNEGRR